MIKYGSVNILTSGTNNRGQKHQRMFEVLECLYFVHLMVHQRRSQMIQRLGLKLHRCRIACDSAMMSLRSPTFLA